MGEIVAFPTPPRPMDGRLRDALQGLVQSVENQQRAIAEWQAALLRLRQAMCSLDHGMQAYQRRLNRAEAGVTGLRNSAVRLEVLADTMSQWGQSVSRTVSP